MRRAAAGPRDAGVYLDSGLGLGLRGTAAVNLVFIAMWMAVAWRLRTEYVRTIHESIHRHRLDTERAASTTIEKSAAEALAIEAAGGDADEVRYAFGLLEVQRTSKLAAGVARAAAASRG